MIESVCNEDYSMHHVFVDHSNPSVVLHHSLKHSNDTLYLLESIVPHCQSFQVALVALAVYVVPHIAMVSELFRHAGGCLTHHPTLLLQPVVTFFVLLGLFFIWVWVMVSLATASK